MGEIPTEVTTFVHQNLNSVDELRILLLLCRSPGKEWDAWTVSSMLYLKPDVASGGLVNLQAIGLLANIAGKERVYRYAPKDAQVDDLVRQVVHLDETQPVTLINLVYSRPKDIQAFADAFKLRKSN
jgi:hypothetical protein